MATKYDAIIIGAGSIGRVTACYLYAVFMITGLFVSLAGVARADGTSAIPRVLLAGEGDDEIAPHGGGNVYAPCVLRDGGILKMWYGGQNKHGHDHIRYAESRDGGSTWGRKNVILKDDTANHVNDPCVLKVKDRYFMFYTRTAKDVVDRIDVATSADGLTWDVRGVALGPGENGSWDGLSVGRPAVLFEGGQFKMWYDGRKDFPPDAPVKDVPKSNKSRRGVGYATSRDGLRWVRSKKNPVFGQDAGAVDVKRIGTKLVLLYESREGTRLAISKDGITWTDRGVFVPRSGKDDDAFGHVTPCLLFDPARQVYQLYFGAAAATTWDHNQIGVVPVSAERLNRFLNKE